MSKKPHLVVLGGGYVTASVTKALRKPIQRGELRVTVITRETYLAFHGFMGEMLTGRILPSQVINPIRRMFPPAEILVAEISDVNLAEKSVTIKRQLDGRVSQISYDHLLIALGVVDNLEAYPGLREHGFLLQTYDDCVRLRSHIINMFELASLTQDPAEQKQLLTFFVAGGGYAGTEIAGEIADLCRLLTQKEFKHIGREQCRVVMVTPGERILPELYSGIGAAGYGNGYPHLVEFAMKHMQKLGVEIVTNTRVTHVSPHEVGLNNGQRIPTRTVISAVGKKPSPLVQKLDLPHDERGRIKTDSTMRVIGQEHIWAAGDCAAIPNPNNPAEHTCPSNAVWALEEGKHLGKNIAAVVRGEKPTPLAYKGLGQGASIGRRTGVGEFWGWSMRGLPSWLMWRFMLHIHVPTLDRQLRLLADWLIWPLVGRDIVDMSIKDADDYEIAHHIFQPGEIIIAENQTGDYLFLLLEGEVEVRDTQTGQTKQVTAGGYFGENPHEEVQAAGVVKVVTVRKDQAAQLKQVLTPLLQIE